MGKRTHSKAKPVVSSSKYSAHFSREIAAGYDQSVIVLAVVILVGAGALGQN